MTALKVYGWIGSRQQASDGHGHYQTREIMAAHSRAEVLRAVGHPSLFNLDATGNDNEILVALSKPGTIFWKGLNDYPELGRGAWREDGSAEPVTIGLHGSCLPHIKEVWRDLVAALLKHGNAGIALDMEDYGREPGDIAWVTVGRHSAFGRVCEALAAATRRADGDEEEPNATLMTYTKPERILTYVHAPGGRLWHAVRPPWTTSQTATGLGRALCGFLPKSGWTVDGKEPPGRMPGCSVCDDRLAGRVRRGPLVYAGRPPKLPRRRQP